ncbi:hypothetical protein U9M48_043118 [Paspalum notatum var. saurae]|uniref:Uncharacterized protein n=1 Tax=Paspalum notatum var. saurae TaxID=547442 RepID=A0AAQ3XF98_PASNO
MRRRPALDAPPPPSASHAAPPFPQRRAARSPAPPSLPLPQGRAAPHRPASDSRAARLPGRRPAPPLGASSAGVRRPRAARPQPTSGARAPPVPGRRPTPARRPSRPEPQKETMLVLEENQSLENALRALLQELVVSVRNFLPNSNSMQDLHGMNLSTYAKLLVSWSFSRNLGFHMMKSSMICVQNCGNVNDNGSDRISWLLLCCTAGTVTVLHSRNSNRNNQ